MKDLTSSLGQKKLYVQSYHLPNILFRGTKHRVRKQFCSSSLEKNELKFIEGTHSVRVSSL